MSVLIAHVRMRIVFCLLPEIPNSGCLIWVIYDVDSSLVMKENSYMAALLLHIPICSKPGCTVQWFLTVGKPLLSTALRGAEGAAGNCVSLLNLYTTRNSLSDAPINDQLVCKSKPKHKKCAFFLFFLHYFL